MAVLTVQDHGEPGTKGALMRGAVNGIAMLGILLALLALSRQLSDGRAPVDLGWQTLGFVAVSSAMLLAVVSFTWRHCVRAVSERTISHSQALVHSAFMLIGKYVPGKVWGVALRAATASTCRLTPGTVLKGSLLEFGVGVLSAIAVGLPLYLLAPRPELIIPALAALAGGSYYVYRYGLLAVSTTSRFLPRLGARLAPALAQAGVGPGDYFDVLGLFLVQWAIICGVVLALLNTVHEAPPLPIMLVVSGAYPLSVIVGFAAFFAPGGIGVREGTFTTLLLPFLPVEEALGLALLLRVWNVLVDFVAGALGYALFFARDQGGLDP